MNLNIFAVAIISTLASADLAVYCTLKTDPNVGAYGTFADY